MQRGSTATMIFHVAYLISYLSQLMTLHPGDVIATGTPPGPMGSAHPLNAPYQAFQTLDGWINVGAANQANWEKLIAIIGAEQLGHDPRFTDNKARITNRLELEAELNKIMPARSTYYAIICMENWRRRI